MLYTTQVDIPASEWDAFVENHERASFFQLSAWGVLKSEYGWEAQRVGVFDEAGRLVAGAQILYRALPLRLGRLAYIPFGPLVDWQDQTLVKVLFDRIDRIARRTDIAFLKIEPGYDVPVKALERQHFKESPHTIQPPRTLILDIGGFIGGKKIDEDAILKRMNQSTRRNIRKAAKEDVEIREGSQADLEAFNALLSLTSDRQDFGVHVPSYYQRVYDLFIAGDSPAKASLLMASYTDPESKERKDLAGVVVFVFAGQSWYVYGASSNDERQRRASFGIQWAAIQWARQLGAKTYDMVGVPDEDETFLEAKFEERSDGLWGVYRFKRGFGGRVVRTVGAWDRVYNPLVYRLYRLYLFWQELQANSKRE